MGATWLDRRRIAAPNLVTGLGSSFGFITLGIAYYWQTRYAAWFLIAAG